MTMSASKTDRPGDLTLEKGEQHLQRFTADRHTYLRGQIQLALLAAVGAAVLLWILGNPDIWAGPVAALAAIGLRGWYLASEELSYFWDLTDRRLLGPGGRQVALAQIETLRRLGNMVQIVTKAGDKHLIKAQRDPAQTLALINAAKETNDARP